MVEQISAQYPESQMKWVHPWDPHPPSSSRLLPECIRPYPSFEGWFFRIVDPSKGVSLAVIVATNYATWESHCTIVFCIDDGESRNTDGSKHGGRTHRVQALVKDARITSLSHLQDNNTNSSEPLGFEWEAPELGKVIVRPNETKIDICVMGYHLKANLISQVHWNQSSSYKGPYGWARILPIMPTHWHIHSVGSEASYEFSNNNEISINSQGWAHEEKNWGLTFPAGHIWLQAISDDNSAQLVFAGGYYELGAVMKTPYIGAMGFWSPSHKIEMKNIDIGTIFMDLCVTPREGKFSIKAINPSYTILITSLADPESFCEPILAPVGKLEWKPACRESYLANVKVEVYAHGVWGIPTNKTLVSTQSFNRAALEFGEDLCHED